MKKTFLIVFVSLLALLFSSKGYTHQYALCEYNVDKYQRFLEQNKEKYRMIHGYYPYFFSSAGRSHHWYSAEEKGHYILGERQNAYPTIPDIIVAKRNSEALDSSGILISLPSVKEKAKEEIVMIKEEPQKVTIERVNDSQDLPAVIKQHKWTFQSQDFAKAVRLP